MASLYLSANREGGKTLSIAPITNRIAAMMDPPVAALDGYFLVESDGRDSAVLARVETEDAALKLARLLGLV
ncbi:MAG TPA: hypothetical protein VFQ67_04820 [Allosphingosinicella sp.]|jgi:hypothetical protein|nr:hypothetical protein [Allosphingosinicella sp.]